MEASKHGHALTIISSIREPELCQSPTSVAHVENHRSSLPYAADTLSGVVSAEIYHLIHLCILCSYVLEAPSIAVTTSLAASTTCDRHSPECSSSCTPSHTKREASRPTQIDKQSWPAALCARLFHGSVEIKRGHMLEG